MNRERPMTQQGTDTGALVKPRSRVRWRVAAMIFVATFVLYLDRANLGVAAPHVQEELHISPAAMGLILGAFFWPYALMQIPVGRLIDRFGPRATYAFAVVWWSCCTALTSLARGFGSLLGLRLLLGVGESPAYPTNAKVVSQWFPRRERALASGIFDSGAQAGGAVAIPLVSLIIAGVGWRASFVVTGLVGLVWVAVWLRFYRTPRTHPTISAEEVAYIEDGEQASGTEESNAVSWRRLVRSRQVWGLTLGFLCLNFVIYFFITWFPSYLVSARGFSLLELGTVGVIPPLAAVAGDWLGGLFSGYLLRRGCSLTFARKLPIVVGMLLMSLIAVAVVVPSAVWAIVLLSICNGAGTFAAASVWALSADMAPTPGSAGTLAGIQNFGANVGGMVSPVLIGVMVGANHGSYVAPLVLAGGVAVVGALCYLTLVGKVARIRLS